MSHGSRGKLVKNLNKRATKVPSSSCPIIWRDNIGAICIVANLVAHAGTKHIKVDIHFVCDKLLQKELNIQYVLREDQVVDKLIKPLFISQSNVFKVKLN